jgi:putative phosphoribosyl transferase
MIFKNRYEAGKKLADALGNYFGRPDVVVLALPRGGVPVGFELAEALHAPLDVFLVRKLGVPGHEELAMGAIASNGVMVLNEGVINAYGISESQLEKVAEREREEIVRRAFLYRGDSPELDLKNKTVILVDDGFATGASMRAAATAVRQLQPSYILLAVPTAPPETCELLETIADEVLCLITPTPFAAVGYWYEDFSQTTDEEVRELLDRAKNRFQRHELARLEDKEAYESRAEA